MVILQLIAILILSGTISTNGVEVVKDATVLFGSIFLAYLAACLLPGYAHARAASMPGMRAAEAVRGDIPSQHVTRGAGMVSLSRHDVAPSLRVADPPGSRANSVKWIPGCGVAVETSANLGA